MLRTGISCLLLTVAAVLYAPPAMTEPPQIENLSQPLGGLHTWRCEEQWRVGEEDDEVIFGSITGATMDAMGRIYILDAQLSTIQVFNTEWRLRQ